MLNILSTCRRLPAILALAAFLILPLGSFGQDFVAACAQDSCVCLVAPADSTEGDDGRSPEGPHDRGVGECCDGEKGSLDAVEPADPRLAMNIHPGRLFYPDPENHFPMVYLSIFVPPESR